MKHALLPLGIHNPITFFEIVSSTDHQAVLLPQQRLHQRLELLACYDLQWEQVEYLQEGPVCLGAAQAADNNYTSLTSYSYGLRDNSNNNNNEGGQHNAYPFSFEVSAEILSWAPPIFQRTGIDPPESIVSVSELQSMRIFGMKPFCPIWLLCEACDNASWVQIDHSTVIEVLYSDSAQGLLGFDSCQEGIDITCCSSGFILLWLGKSTNNLHAGIIVLIMDAIILK